MVPSLGHALPLGGNGLANATHLRRVSHILTNVWDEFDIPGLKQKNRDRC
jgi:hypothetical protein